MKLIEIKIDKMTEKKSIKIWKLMTIQRVKINYK